MNNDINYLHGGDIYQSSVRLDFSVNLNPAGTPDAVLQAAKDSMRQICNYPDPEQRALRAALSGVLQIPAEQFLFGNGAAELIDAYLTAAAPRRILLPQPSFSEYRRIPEIQACEILSLQLDEDKQFLLQETILARLTQAGAALLIHGSPNTPTGGMIRPQLW